MRILIRRQPRTLSIHDLRLSVHPPFPLNSQLGILHHQLRYIPASQRPMSLDVLRQRAVQIAGYNSQSAGIVEDSHRFVTRGRQDTRVLDERGHEDASEFLGKVVAGYKCWGEV